MGLPFLALDAGAQESKKLKIMMKSAWGSDDPTRASFPFLHGLALADVGHEVRIFLTGEATYLMRKATVDTIFPIGWPPLSETRVKIVARGNPIFSCGACSQARGVAETDLKTREAKFGNPAIFVSLMLYSKIAKVFSCDILHWLPLRSFRPI